MKEFSCKSCKNYLPHYVITDERGYVEVSGHCMARLGMRRDCLCVQKCDKYEKLNKRQQVAKIRRTAWQTIESMDVKLQKIADFIDSPNKRSK